MDITSLSLPQTIKNIGDSAFLNCTALTEITCYSKRVPVIAEHTFDNVDKDKCILYVLADCVNKYVDDYYWGDFMDIRPISSQEVSVSIVEVQPSMTTAEVAFPKNDNADSYEIIIEQGSIVFCTLTFNAYGQLTGIQFAPSRKDNQVAAQQTPTGWKFTVTGLTENTEYDYTVEARNGTSIIYSEQGSFMTTSSPTAIENQMVNGKWLNGKCLKDGQLLILHGEKVYTVTGHEIE